MEKKRSGLFVTFEGTEGAGKSTLIRTLAEQLKARGAQVTLTREPGGSEVAEKIRSLILDHPMDAYTELFLYEAARAEHLAKTVMPALESGTILLCDRFTDSSLAYQGFARGLPWDKVKALNKIATRGLKPDLTVLVDIDPAVGLERTQKRGADQSNRFEAEGVEFQKKVRQGFLKARKEDPKRWLTLKAGTASAEDLAAQVIKKLRSHKKVKALSW